MPGEATSVKVYARFRPLNNREQTKQTDSDIKFDFASDNKNLKMTYNQVSATGASQLKELDFAADRIFKTDATQEEVFDEMARPMVEEVIKGYNATIFAYGQTGSGKTHCMFGPSKKKSELGVIPRSADYIFEVLAHDPEILEATIKISVMEIYMENVKDLFVPTETSLKIRETPSGASYVAGIHEEYVTSGEDLMALVEIAQKNRATAATNMNATSSRSHCVLIITVSTKTRDGTVRVGKLNLADLAGSEKVKSTGATGQTLKEAQMINQSLSALGNCINALTDAGRSHVPFRDSQLTFLLKDSLGGNTKTALMVACSPAAINGEETYGTLKFAQRAKMVQNTVSVNAEMSVAQLKEVVESLQKQIVDLKTSNPDKSAEALAEMTKQRDALVNELRVVTEARNRAVQDLQAFKTEISTRFQGVQPQTPTKESEYANNPFAAQPPTQKSTTATTATTAITVTTTTATTTIATTTAIATTAAAIATTATAIAATGSALPPPPVAKRAPPPPTGAKKSESKVKSDSKAGDSEGDTDSEAELSEEESPVVNWKQESKEDGLYHLIMDLNNLKKENEKLKKDLRDALKQLHEIQLRQVGSGGAKILKPVVPPKSGPLAAIGAVAKDALESVVANIGEHLIADDVRLHEKDKIVHFCVRSCASSADSATSALVDVTNWALRGVSRVLKKKQKNLQKMRHHWIEPTLPIGFILIQKHPNGCISMDFVNEASAMREMVLEAANTAQNDIPAGKEDIKTEEEDSDPGVRVMSEVLRFVESQPAKYRSVDLNAKKFALDVIKWYKARGDAEGKTA
jgi:hypothetical protein